MTLDLPGWLQQSAASLLAEEGTLWLSRSKIPRFCSTGLQRWTPELLVAILQLFPLEIPINSNMTCFISCNSIKSMHSSSLAETASNFSISNRQRH